MPADDHPGDPSGATRPAATSPTPDPSEHRVAALSPWGRRIRVSALAVAGVALLAGTAWGEDDHFPFGPFRMYARATRTTGQIVVPRVEATTVGGEDIRVGWDDLGLRRAELEGQINRLTRDTDVLLDAVADTYERRNPDAPRLAELRLQRRITRLVDGEVTGRREETVAVWRP